MQSVFLNKYIASYLSALTLLAGELCLLGVAELPWADCRLPSQKSLLGSPEARLGLHLKMDQRLFYCPDWSCLLPQVHKQKLKKNKQTGSNIKPQPILIKLHIQNSFSSLYFFCTFSCYWPAANLHNTLWNVMAGVNLASHDFFFCCSFPDFLETCRWH